MNSSQILAIRNLTELTHILQVKLSGSANALQELVLTCDHKGPSGEPARLPIKVPCPCGKEHEVCSICNQTIDSGPHGGDDGGGGGGGSEPPTPPPSPGGFKLVSLQDLLKAAVNQEVPTPKSGKKKSAAHVKLAKLKNRRISLN